VYLTWSFSAVCDDLGVPRGVMTISFETSAEVISSRQIQYTALVALSGVALSRPLAHPMTLQ
jgi:hypothetical protein